jgi:hypothetical protein
MSGLSPPSPRFEHQKGGKATLTSGARQAAFGAVERGLLFWHPSCRRVTDLPTVLITMGAFALVTIISLRREKRGA